MIGNQGINDGTEQGGFTAAGGTVNNDVAFVAEGQFEEGLFLADRVIVFADDGIEAERFGLVSTAVFFFDVIK